MVQGGFAAGPSPDELRCWPASRYEPRKVNRVFRHGALRLYLLKLLGEQPRHGYEVISLLEDRFLGLYAPSAGTVYPRLARLETEGLVEHREADGRKVYSLTDAGRAELARQEEALRTL